jgi:hypothetical protein
MVGHGGKNDRFWREKRRSSPGLGLGSGSKSSRVGVGVWVRVRVRATWIASFELLPHPHVRLLEQPTSQFLSVGRHVTGGGVLDSLHHFAVELVVARVARGIEGDRIREEKLSGIVPSSNRR